MKVAIVIPSRMGSSRFPGKPLAKICDREMILHVCDRASQVAETYVATPDQCIADLVEKAGYNAILTGDHLTGTDRVAEAAESIEADIIVNVQGDEPLVKPEDIDKLVFTKEKYYNTVIGSMMLLGRNGPNIVKVIHNAGLLMGLTRTGTARFAQCGLYAFTKSELKAFASISEEEKIKSLKTHEDIEIMRFMEIGIPVKMAEVLGSPAVDCLDDIQIITEVIRHG